MENLEYINFYSAALAMMLEDYVVDSGKVKFAIRHNVKEHFAAK